MATLARLGQWRITAVPEMHRSVTNGKSFWEKKFQKKFLLLYAYIKGMEVVACIHTSRIKISMDAWGSLS